MDVYLEDLIGNGKPRISCLLVEHWPTQPLMTSLSFALILVLLWKCFKRVHQKCHENPNLERERENPRMLQENSSNQS